MYVSRTLQMFKQKRDFLENSNEIIIFQEVVT